MITRSVNTVVIDNRKGAVERFKGWFKRKKKQHGYS